MKLAKNTSRLDIRRHFFFNRVQNEWNGLGAHVVESTTVDGFKKAYDRYQISDHGGSTKRIWSSQLRNH